MTLQLLKVESIESDIERITHVTKAPEHLQAEISVSLHKWLRAAKKSCWISPG